MDYLNEPFQDQPQHTVFRYPTYLASLFRWKHATEQVQNSENCIHRGKENQKMEGDVSIASTRDIEDKRDITDCTISFPGRL